VQVCCGCFQRVIQTLNKMLMLAIDDSCDDAEYGRALRGARLFMTITWVSRLVPCRADGRAGPARQTCLSAAIARVVLRAARCSRRT
jgi:hypothetical protein